MTVFANGLEVACKAQSNQVIAAFPYVCMTPPQTPATPPGVPVPYPTFGLDGDTDKGTGTVKIGGKTVTQKNLSYYTKCTGNEAGCAPMKNVISHVNTGKEYAHAWSGNVKMDGEPISRFTDLSTNDHASPQAGGPPSGKMGGAGGGGGGGDEVDCDALAEEIEALVARNKHEHNGRGVHGYLHRRAEQTCGEMPPGTDGYNTHQEELQRTYDALEAKVDEFFDGNCDLDDYVFSPQRRDGGRTDRIKEVVNRVRERDPDIQPTSVQFLGRNHPTCANLDAARRDKTLSAIFGILGF